MNGNKRDAREYLDFLNSENRILRLAHFVGSNCEGRGKALILDDESQIALMLEDCGDPAQSEIRAGCFVNYVSHTEAEPKIVGTPASIRD